mmetsp:Transcript_74372/g.206041  ORF Transcript_74372/g.206041 Transcript_74372/m.206041 type:complete len:321 (-) Transcript_74372:138-1100(-)
MEGVPLRVLADADLCCDLDLDRLCTVVFVNCELSRTPTAALVIHMQRCRSIVKVRRSGEVNLAGQCSPEEARAALKKVAYRCGVAGYPVHFRRFVVRSVKWCAAYRPQYPIDIIRLGQHPLAEIRQTSTAQPLRVFIHLLARDALVGARARRAAEGDRERPAKRRKTRQGEAGDADAGEEDEERSDDERSDEERAEGMGVRAVVAADGRVRFQGARSVDELEKALAVVIPILEEHRCQVPAITEAPFASAAAAASAEFFGVDQAIAHLQPTPQHAQPQQPQGSQLQRLAPGGAQGRGRGARRGANLSQASLSLEAPRSWV